MDMAYFMWQLKTDSIRMKKNYKISFILFLYLCPLLWSGTYCEAFSQNKNIDSLLTLLKTDKADTNKVIHSYKLCWEYIRAGLYDSAMHYGNDALQLAEQLSFKKGIVGAYGNIANAYYELGDYPKALDYYFKTLKIAEEIGDKKLIVRWLGNIGVVFCRQGDYPKSLGYYFKALNISEKMDDKKGIASVCNNIGIIYKYKKDYLKALNYFSKALKISELLDDKSGVANSLGNIGIIHDNLGEYDAALEYYFKSLEIAQELDNKKIIAGDLGNIGSVYNAKKNYFAALNFYSKALKIDEELGNKNGIAIKMGNIGSLYTSIKNYTEAEKYLKKSLSIAEEIGSLADIKDANEYLSVLYSQMGKHQKAMDHYKKSMIARDSIFNEAKNYELLRKEMSYELSKSELAAKAEQEKLIAQQEAEKKKQQIILWSIISGLFLVLIFAGFIYRSLHITNKQKNIIELQKNEVSKQKEIVEKQKEKIIDSITYAQHIQQSILIEEDEIKHWFPDSFIYYQPKDIVSGDFYWYSKIGNKIILAAIDCTGHGVPGAFMSIIGNTLLNQIVNENHITRPSEILLYLNTGIYKALRQGKDKTLSRDGMDIALCCFDFSNNELQYAGAKNPLYLFIGNEITIIKGDRQTIGGNSFRTTKKNVPEIQFTNHVIQIEKGTCIYMFTDGYLDQFGGNERKKFSAHKFQKLLSNHYHNSMEKQKEIIAATHKEWKGHFQQTDDVLVMGIRI